MDLRKKLQEICKYKMVINFQSQNLIAHTLVSRISVQARISKQGGILIKILEYRVKTGNIINNKKDF